VDVFDPSLGTPPVQIHDLNPGIEPDGLFWTVALPDDSVDVNFGNGFASLEGTKVPIDDYGNIANALLGGGPAPVPGLVSFTVEWSGVDERVKIRNTDPPLEGGGFAGEFIRNDAQMEWTAVVGNLKFVSDPLETSSSDFAEIGRERNGAFFP
jgi:hypothetical protein